MEATLRYHSNILEQMRRSMAVLEKDSDKYFDELVKLADQCRNLQIQIVMAKRQNLTRFDPKTYLAEELK